MSNTEDDIAWRQAFADLSAPHWDALLRFGGTLTRSREASHDLLQSALLRGLKYFRSFAEKNFVAKSASDLGLVFADETNAKRFRSWLYAIVRNVFYDEKKLTDRFVLEENFDHLEDPADTDVVEVDSEEHFFSLATDDTLKQKLGELNPKQRSLLYLVADGYSYKEAAHILDIPIGTVMSGLSRALKKLRSG